MMKKTSADLGNKNIPKPFILQLVPGELRALYWREESVSPENVTIEIWGSDSATFYLFSGDFGRGQWSLENIQFLGEFKTVDEAIAVAKSNFVVKQNEEPNQLVTSNDFKRLIKKN